MDKNAKDKTASANGATDRIGMEVLSFSECEALLKSGIIGRIGMMVAGEPVILPVNYQYIDGSVVFRTGRGEKADVATMGSPVAFEIDAWSAVERRGWSVLVKGSAEEMRADDPMIEAADALAPWVKEPDRDVWVRIVANEVTGRRIVES